jgi:hypothetical protein
MKTTVCLWCLSELILEWNVFQTEVVEIIIPLMLCSINFFWKSCWLWDKVVKYDRAGQATDAKVIQHRKDVICIPGIESKNTGLIRNIEYLTLFHGRNGYTYVPHLLCYMYNAYIVLNSDYED